MRIIDGIRVWAVKEALQQEKPGVSVTHSNPPDLGDTPVQALQQRRSKSKIKGPRVTSKIKNDNETDYKPTIHGVRQG